MKCDTVFAVCFMLEYVKRSQSNSEKKSETQSYSRLYKGCQTSQELDHLIGQSTQCLKSLGERSRVLYFKKMQAIQIIEPSTIDSPSFDRIELRFNKF